MSSSKQAPLLSRDGVNLLLPFIIITSCFALWGFANDITGPLVKAFSKIFRMSVTEGALVQVAFYLGYFCMAFPAALFIQRYSYKAGVLLGLSLYAVGAAMFIPAQMAGFYYPFLAAYFIMTCGLSFLETSCNPYIYCMGPEESATRRLNLAQAFNPIGALAGMYVAMHFVQERLHPLDTAERALLSPEEFEQIKSDDLWVLIQPYIYIAAVLVAIIILVRLLKMPKAGDTRSSKKLSTALGELVRIKNYREGVIAQFFYVGAQVMCWTFIIQYGTHVFMSEGMDERSAEILSQKFNIAALICFTCSRFVCTWFLKYSSRHPGGHFLCRRHSDDRPLRRLLPRRHQRLHVAHVPHHLRHSPARTRRQCQIRQCRTYHVDSRRLGVSPAPGPRHRLRSDRRRTSVDQSLIRHSSDLLHCHHSLRNPRLSPHTLRRD